MANNRYKKLLSVFLLKKYIQFWFEQTSCSKSPAVLRSLPLIWFSVVMDQNLENYDLNPKVVNDESHLRANLKTHYREKSNKCYQCDFASSYASALRAHLKTHSGEKPNKCNLCDYTCSQSGNLGRHLKTHSGIKSIKWKQFDLLALKMHIKKGWINLFLVSMQCSNDTKCKKKTPEFISEKYTFETLDFLPA